MNQINNQSDENIVSKKYLVLYLDFLGSEERIEKDSENQSFRDIYDVYKNLIDEKYEISLKMLKPGKSFVKIFSDNLIVGVEDDGVSVKSLYYLMKLAASLQFNSLLKYKWLIRGSIVTGELCVGKLKKGKNKRKILADVVWGKALVRAHQIEEEVAIFPRIIIDSGVLNSLSLSLIDKNINQKMKNAIDDYIVRDSDNLCYLDYNGLFKSESGGVSESSKKTLFEQIDSKLFSLGTDNIKVSQKYLWTKNYLQLSDAEKLTKWFSMEKSYDKRI